MGDSELELYPEAVKARQNTYSSLTDLSGINIFTDEFQEKTAQQKAQEENSRIQVMQNVFLYPTNVPNSMDAEYMTLIFQKEEETALMQDYQQNSMGISYINIGMVLMAVLAVSALYAFLFHDKKERSKEI